MENLIPLDSQFGKDVLAGLVGMPKCLPSKYFYNEAGDKIFQEIMDMPEYYVSKCETQLLQAHAENIAKTVSFLFPEHFNVIELGAGDASKSLILLQELERVAEKSFSYFPIDISSHVIDDLHLRLPDELPSVTIFGIADDYIAGLRRALFMANSRYGSSQTLVLFLGSSIGNFTVEETKTFLRIVRSKLEIGDMMLTGFDLTSGFGKTPETILNAYNDPAGITKRFNLNLLTRINAELGANFDIKNFDHRPTYDPITGECKSFIYSLISQDIQIGHHIIHFDADETIYTEISQKYDDKQLDEIALDTGFFPLYHYYDELGWYTDTLWQVH